MERITTTSAAATPDEPGAPPPVDEQVVATLVEELGDGDGSILQDLIDSYLDEATQQVAQIEVAAQAGDGATVAAIAHSLKSASGALGALPLAQLLQRAETIGKSAGSNLPALVEPIHNEFSRAAEALRRLRATG